MCTMNQRMRQKLCFYQPGSTSGASCHWRSCRDAHWPPQTGTPGRRTAPRSPCVACVHLQRYSHQSSSSPASNVWCDSCLACNVFFYALRFCCICLSQMFASEEATAPTALFDSNEQLRGLAAYKSCSGWTRTMAILLTNC